MEGSISAVLLNHVLALSNGTIIIRPITMMTIFFWISYLSIYPTLVPLLLSYLGFYSYLFLCLMLNSSHWIYNFYCSRGLTRGLSKNLFINLWFELIVPFSLFCSCYFSLISFSFSLFYSILNSYFTSVYLFLNSFINFINLINFIILVDRAPIFENLLALLTLAKLMATWILSVEFMRSYIQMS